MKQNELAALFGKSQQTISRLQRRKVDPLPADMDAAIAWGKRNGLLSDDGVPGGLTAEPGPLQTADLALKEARRRKIEKEIGDVLTRDEVDGMLVSVAVEFRKTAADFSVRLRPILERHIADGPTVAVILKDVDTCIRELMNHADSHEVLKGRDKAELRQILMERVDACLAAL